MEKNKKHLTGKDEAKKLSDIIFANSFVKSERFVVERHEAHPQVTVKNLATYKKADAPLFALKEVVTVLTTLFEGVRT